MKKFAKTDTQFPKIIKDEEHTFRLYELLSRFEKKTARSAPLAIRTFETPSIFVKFSLSTVAAISDVNSIVMADEGANVI